MKAEPDLIQEGLWWSQGLVCVAGVDEAGRGPWAGPVVAGAVVLPPDPAVARALAGVRDSKQLSPRQRERLFAVIQATAVSWAPGVVPSEEIDRLGILPATRLAMRQAVAALGASPQALLVDAVRLPAILLPQRSLIHGDALSLSIAAASIVAKVTRDRLNGGEEPLALPRRELLGVAHAGQGASHRRIGRQD
ncbi:MAG: ribonuclease HII, partial [Chloroflexota bacterium]|nr:ribonuclease HII [Chloroflexota bacterium]